MTQLHLPGFLAITLYPDIAAENRPDFVQPCLHLRSLATESGEKCRLAGRATVQRLQFWRGLVPSRGVLGKVEGQIG